MYTASHCSFGLADVANGFRSIPACPFADRQALHRSQATAPGDRSRAGERDAQADTYAAHGLMHTTSDNGAFRVVAPSRTYGVSPLSYVDVCVYVREVGPGWRRRGACVARRSGRTPQSNRPSSASTQRTCGSITGSPARPGRATGSPMHSRSCAARRLAQAAKPGPRRVGWPSAVRHRHQTLRRLPRGARTYFG